MKSYINLRNELTDEFLLAINPIVIDAI